METMPSSMEIPDNDAIPFNQRLLNFRDAHGFSREALATELGVTSITLYRWETGSTRPSPLAAEKLISLGFGTVTVEETNHSAVPRLKRLDSSSSRAATAADFREAGYISAGKKNDLRLLPAPFVRNGPPDQSAFHKRLIDMQISGNLPAILRNRRLSMVEAVDGAGSPDQHKLEKPKATAVSWNSNYGTHGWHRYVGRFPAHVVRALLNYFGADSRSLVCDPFVGSGTTAVECRLLGIPFIGVEICPLSAMITRTKAAFPNDISLLKSITPVFSTFYQQQWDLFQTNLKSLSFTHNDVLQRSGNKIPSFTNIERWFTPEALLGTSITVEFALREKGFLREALLTALSSKMRSIGNVDVDVVRAEYSKTPRLNVDVRNLVTRQLNKMSGDILSCINSHSETIGSPDDITVHEGSILDSEFEKGSISHVITSPPYGVEALSYLRTHLLSYRSLVSHLGHDPYDTRAKTIGSEYLTVTDESAGNESRKHSPSCNSFFDRTTECADKKYEQRRMAMMQFCDDMWSVGNRLAKWVKPGGQIAFIIGNKRLGDEIIPMDKIVTELFANCGLKPTDSIRHKLKTNNSNSQVPWQERVIQEESILLFKRA